MANREYKFLKTYDYEQYNSNTKNEKSNIRAQKWW